MGFPGAFAGRENRRRVGLRPVQAHDEVDGVVWRGQPVGFLIGAGRVFLDVDGERAVVVLFHVRHHWGVDEIAVDRVFDQELALAVVHRYRPESVDRRELSAEIASLSKLDTDELRARWKAMFGNPPPRDISRSFLTRAIAYHLQEKAFGGLKPSTQRLLAEFAYDGANASAAVRSRILRPGAVLV